MSSSRNSVNAELASGTHSPPTPQPPPEPTAGVPSPTYLAHDGYIWRRGMKAWTTIDPADPHVLLKLFRDDAANQADWFHARSAELATELETAMRELGLLDTRKEAA